MLQLWIENDGRSAHLVNEAGGKVVSGVIRPTPGVADLVRGAESGTPVECGLQFEGTVL